MLVGEVRIATTGVGVFLEVVGREPAGLGGDEAVEEAPVQQRVAERLASGSPAGSRRSRLRWPGALSAWATAGEAQPRARTSGATADGELPPGRPRRSPARRPPRHTTVAQNRGRQRHRRPHAPPDARGEPRHAALDLRRRLPLEQVPARDRHAPERADDRVGRDPGLVRQEGDGERDLLRRWWPRPVRPPRSRRATTCRAAAAATASSSETIHGAAIGAEPQQGPAERRAGQAASSRPTRKSELRDLHGAAPQVVEDLPARQRARAGCARGRPGPGTVAVSHGSSCQSPRIQRCFRRV